MKDVVCTPPGVRGLQHAAADQHLDLRDRAALTKQFKHYLSCSYKAYAMARHKYQLQQPHTTNINDTHHGK